MYVNFWIGLWRQTCFLLTEFKELQHSISDYGTQKKFVDTIFDVNSTESKEAIHKLVNAGSYNLCADMFPCEDSETVSVCPYPEKRNHHSFVNISPILVIDTSMERSSQVLYHENAKIWS